MTVGIVPLNNTNLGTVQLATANAPVAAGTGTSAVVVKAAPGYLKGVLITATGSTGLSIYDNSSAASGTIIGIIPSTGQAVGQFYPFDMPAMNGITAGQVNGSPAVTVSYS